MGKKKVTKKSPSPAEKATAQGKKGRAKLLLISAGVILCAGIVWFVSDRIAKAVNSLMRNSAAFVVRTVSIDVNDSLRREDISAIAEIKPGVKMMDVKCEQIARNVESLPYVKKARVSRLYPNKIRISITEREPVALVAVGRVFWTDSDGRLIPLMPGTLPDVPVVTGLNRVTDSSGVHVAPADVKRVLRIINTVRGYRLPKLTQIEFVGRGPVRLRFAGLTATVEMHEDTAVDRMSDLKRLMSSLRNSEDAVPVRIDMRYDNLAFVE